MSLAVCTAGLCGNETASGVFVHALYSFSLLGTGSSRSLHTGFTSSCDGRWGATGHYMGAYLRLLFFLLLLKRTDVPHFAIGVVPSGCLQGDPEYGLSRGRLPAYLVISPRSLLLTPIR
mmetsp:Transcript_22580/g.33260  ORF Transcript_22580/g.33260 Transcript_22580/m.33260 type:complete len:119 (-) Transcript_22580:441-797(-)